MINKGLLLLFACVVAVKSCCVPEIYTAETFIHIYKDGHFFKGEGEMYYNSSLGIHASFINISNDEFPDTFSLTSNHIDIKAGIIYEMSDGDCRKIKLDVSWLQESDLPHCIPKGAHFERDLAIGGPHEDIEVETYSHKIYHGIRHLTVSAHHCYPIQEVFYGKNSTSEDGTIVQIMNLELSVADPSVFVIPELCLKKPLMAPTELPHAIGFLPNLLKTFH